MDYKICKLNILQHLELLSNYKAQLQYQKDVPIADVMGELICIWFDDAFSEGLQKIPEIKNEFTSEEWKLLIEFSTFFDSLVSKFSSRHITEAGKDRDWLSMIEKAGETLSALGGFEIIREMEEKYEPSQDYVL